ncbi:MAG: signal recognition particle-docking protein FtsY [Firmicutes bacterium]|nr:signal recognition particle-docking protein FtsY [Bacillota bacterium]
MADNENKKKGFFSGVFDKIASKFKKAPQVEVQETPQPVEEEILPVEEVEEEIPVPVVEEKPAPAPVIPVIEKKPAEPAKPVVVEKPAPRVEEKPAPALFVKEKPVSVPEVKEEPKAAPRQEEKPISAPVIREKPKAAERPAVIPPPPAKEKISFIPFGKEKAAPEKKEEPVVKPAPAPVVKEASPVVAPKVELKPEPAPVVQPKPVIEEVKPVVQEAPPAPKPKEKPSFLPFFNKEKPAPEPAKEEPIPAAQDKQVAEEAEEEKPKAGFFDKLKPVNWFNRLKEGLDKTRKNLVFKMKGLFRLRESIDDDFWDELEEILLTADVGIDTTEYVIEQMKKAVEEHYIEKPEQLYEVMKDKLSVILDKGETEIVFNKNGLTVILVIGVNGVGKTTSIAKIANRYMQEGKQVLVAAADTFRAAAIEQLEVWGKRLDLEIIRHKEGADPSAVVFDAVSAAIARKADLLIIDTAGRLHSKVNLMKELEKIKKVIQKSVPDGPHETLLVLDSTNGQNAQVQARTFKESMPISGIVLTKLDGTAKGGIIISIVHELGIPIKFIGVGEGVYDLRPFEPRSFLDALFEDDTDKVPVSGS